MKLVVIGGGAGGFFGAISCAYHYPGHQVIILEKTRQLLSKVRISGGGRCNVTHACFEPSLLIKNYPRGSRELLAPFYRFQPKDTMDWFNNRGIGLKIESDGRVFPVTDNSQTIIDCLVKETKNLGIEVLLEQSLKRISKNKHNQFELEFTKGEMIVCDRVLMATGSSSAIYSLLQELGHTIIPLVPSLFTFNLPTSPFLDLAGVSLTSTEVSLPKFSLKQKGPVLFTHWGLSGPAVLKLSSWGARELHTANYETEVILNSLPMYTEHQLREILLQAKKNRGAKQLGSEPPFPLPKQFWKKILDLARCPEETRWAVLSNQHIQALVTYVHSAKFMLKGKTTYKNEFVTCGGVSLSEVNFKTMESRKCPGLYFSGEILDIDGVTGGFNFQNAWTTGWIAGESMGK